MEKDNITERTRDSIARGLAWLKSNDAGIDGMKDLSAHYKACYLYAVTGERVKARKYYELIKNNYLQPDGDFRTSAKEKGWAHIPSSPANRYIYSNGWILLGLERLGAFDLWQKGIGFISRFRDPETGGFFSRYDLERDEIDTTILDVSSTSSAGLAMLYCGHIKEALAAGNFILRVLESQPDAKRYFFTSWKKGSGIMTDVFDEENVKAVRSRQNFCIDAAKDPIFEMIWFLGMSMRFLCALCQVSGNADYLKGALYLHDFYEEMGADRWKNASSTKVMWGGSALYRLTKSEVHRSTAVKILTGLLDAQHESGVWVHSLWWRSIEEQPFPATLDLVQEYVSEFSDVLFDLAY